jgi:CBS domain-containing protein
MKETTAAASAKKQTFKVEDVMSPNPLTLEPTDTIGEAEEIMNEHGFRQIPVVSRKELVGIITDRDVRTVLGGARVSTLEEREIALGTRVAAVMTTKPVSVAPDDDLSEAIELLIDGKMGGIPVVDEEDGLVGIVTYVDVLRCFLDLLEES